MNYLNYRYTLFILFIIVSCSKEKERLSIKQKFNKNWSFKIIENAEVDSLFSVKKIDATSWNVVEIPHTPK